MNKLGPIRFFCFLLGLFGISACQDAPTSSGPASSLNSANSQASAQARPSASALPSLPPNAPKEVRWIAEGGISGCSLAQDSEAVYWADSANALILRVSKTGGEMTIIADAQGKAGSLFVDDRHLFWLAGATQRVRRAPKLGGPFGGLAAGLQNPAHIAIDEKDVFITRRGPLSEGDDAMVLRVSKAGGETAVVARSKAGLKSKLMAMDADFVYFGLNSLERVSKNGGVVQTLQDKLPELIALGLDEEFLYFIAGESPRQGELFRMPKAGGQAISLFKAAENNGDSAPSAFALDARDIFFSDWSGSIQRMPKAGGQPQALAKVALVHQILGDESSLWLCGDHGLWQLSWASIPALPMAFSTHAPAVQSFAFQRDGQWIGADHGGTIYVFDTKSAQGRSLLKVGHSIKSMGLASDGQTLAVADYNGLVEGWDLGSSSLKWSSKAKGGPTTRELSTEIFELSPDGALLFYRRESEPLRILYTESGKQMLNAFEHTSTPSALAIAPDRRFWLTGPVRPPRRKGFPTPPLSKNEPPLRQWEMSSGKEMAVFEGEAELLSALVLSADGKQALSGSDEGEIRLWDIGSRSMSLKLQAKGPIQGLALSRSGRRALSVSPSEGLCLWDLSAQKRIGCAPHRNRSWFSQSSRVYVLFSPGEDEAWWSSYYGYLRWKLPLP